MGAIQFVAVLVRLFALWMAVEVILGFPAINIFFDQENGALARTLMLVLSAGGLVFCWLLWKFPNWVSHKIVPDAGKTDTSSLVAEDLLAIGLVLLGLWSVTSALPHLVRQIVLANSDEYSKFVFGADFNAYTAALAVKVLIGIWLLLGAKGLRRFLRWARTAGVKY